MDAGHCSLTSAEAAVVRLSLIRVSTLAIWLITAIATPYQLYGSFPDWWPQGVGVGALLLNGGPATQLLFSATTLTLVRWTMAVLCASCLIWPHQTRSLIWPLAIVVLLAELLTKSLGGYINHTSSAALMCLFVLVLARDVSFRSPAELAGLYRRPPRPMDEEANVTATVTVWLCALCLVATYTYTGTERMLRGFPMIFVDNSIIAYVGRNSSSFAPFPWLLELPVVNLLLNAGFAVTTAFEVLSVCVFVSTWFRRAWLIFMLGFHIACLLLMNIVFWENAILIVATFAPFGGRRERTMIS